MFGIMIHAQAAHKEHQARQQARAREHKWLEEHVRKLPEDQRGKFLADYHEMKEKARKEAKADRQHQELCDSIRSVKFSIF